MTDRQTATIGSDGEKDSEFVQLKLNLLPSVYVLATHLSLDEQHEAENALRARAAPLTHNIHEAKIVLGNISKAQRAKLELKWKGIVGEVSEMALNEREPIEKKRRTSSDGQTYRTHVVHHENSSTAPDAGKTAADSKKNAESFMGTLSSSPSSYSSEQLIGTPFLDIRNDEVSFIRLDWLKETINSNRILPLEPYTVLKARKSTAPDDSSVLNPATGASIVERAKLLDTSKDLRSLRSSSIVERAKADANVKPSNSRHSKRHRVAEAAKHDIIGKSFSSSHRTRPIKLLHQTTSEANEMRNVTRRSMPDWVLQNKIYSCERSTPPTSPNSSFIELLKTIRLARELTLDQIGVRAYSTSIASIAAYPCALQNSSEVLALPGCDSKIAQLFQEYRTTGQLQAVFDINADSALTCLRSFFDIWGVGAITAREFYYDKGWRDLDDVIEYGWNTLSRVQQIGLKYYDEFKEALSRGQVEAIAAIITQHAAQVTDSRIQSAIVGGYRRGKSESNDVDIILSHPAESQTINLVTKVVNSLEREGWITHTLRLNLTTTNRDQATLPINTSTAPGHGFDTLDKALVVWQSPHWTSQSLDLAADPKHKNPNPHRRVDIIISPWRTVGCAVAGWTSGTTFQRDLRRYCKYKKGWKFDSSGVRERGTGSWVDLEGYRDPETRCKTWQEAEKKVFEGIGLNWVEPWERCTG